jgi:AraC family transcriptional regulator of adaptative response/methylated-DNA-[protein]-cysteine methyltransferase
MPFRRNVRFRARTADAMTAGFRLCRRCRPLRAASDVGLDTVTALVRIIEDAPAEILDLKTLAAKAGYSPSHFQRHFTTIVSLSPRADHAAVRAKIYRRALKEEPNATAALTHAGSG